MDISLSIFTLFILNAILIVWVGIGLLILKSRKDEKRRKAKNQSKLSPETFKRINEVLKDLGR
jgi:hypothetical protein